MEKLSEIKEAKDSIFRAIKHEDNYTLTVKVYDCDEDGEQTYDVEVTLYIAGEYHDTYVTDRGYEGEEAAAVKRAKAVRTAMLRNFENIPPVTVYTM